MEMPRLKTYSGENIYEFRQTPTQRLGRIHTAPYTRHIPFTFNNSFFSCGDSLKGIGENTISQSFAYTYLKTIAILL